MKSWITVLAIALLCSGGALGQQDRAAAPGCTDQEFWEKAEELNRKVASGTLMFPDPPTVEGKDLNKIQDLCMYLVDRHNDMPAGEGVTNADHLGGVTITVEECVNALTSPSGFGPGGFDRWKGKHDGKWTNDSGEMFEDDATWEEERDGERDYGENGPDNYREQPVKFGDGRKGYNGSSSDKDFVWGWDPKDDGSCDKGVHVGYPFDPGDGVGLVNCILWITPTEAFLECIFDDPAAPNARTSTGFWGKGQWEVGPLTNKKVDKLPQGEQARKR